MNQTTSLPNAIEVRQLALRAAMELAANDYVPASATYTIVYTGPPPGKVDVVLADARRIEAFLLGSGDGAQENAKPATAQKVDHMAAVREMAKP